MVNSIKKGKRFELEIANLLTKTTNEKFMRVPMSGAFSTNNNSDNPVFNGDVFSEGKYKRVCIECKSYKHFSLNELFNRNSKLYQWITQAKSESKGLEWLLFIKVKNQGVFVVTTWPPTSTNLQELFYQVNPNSISLSTGFQFNYNDIKYILFKVMI